MTEVSDFGQIMGGEKKSVPLDFMEATAAWQAAWGVTDFHLYYGIKGTPNAPYRNEESHKKYCEFVGRLNAVLLDAEPVRPLLLYYPIETMQHEFCPTKERVNDFPQSDIMQAATGSFVAIGRGLMRSQIPFTVIDGETILELPPERLDEFTGIVFPQNANPAQDVQQKLWEAWKIPVRGGIACTADAARFMTATPETPFDSPETLAESFAPKAGPRLCIAPASDALTQGVFERDGRLVFLLANLSHERYVGTATLTMPSVGKFAERKIAHQDWTAMNPQTGEIKPLDTTDGGETISFSLELSPRETALIVAP